MPLHFSKCEEKVSYVSRDEANRVGASRPQKLWMYQCPSCGMWHLTKSRPPRWLKAKMYPVVKPKPVMTEFGQKIKAALRSTSPASPARV